MPLRHGAHRHVPLVARRAQPAPRERALEHARQLRRPADRLPAARRAPRLDRRHPGVRTDGVVPVRLRRLPHVVAAGPCRRAGRARHGARLRPLDRAAGTRRAGGRMGRRGGGGAVGAARTVRRHRRVAAAVRKHVRLGRPDRGDRRREPSLGHRVPVRRLARPRRPARRSGAARADKTLVATAYHAHTARLRRASRRRARTRRRSARVTNNSPTASSRHSTKSSSRSPVGWRATPRPPTRSPCNSTCS